MDRLVIGFVARPHGVRGELRIQLHSPESSTLYDLRRVYVGEVERAIDSVRPTAGALLLKLVDCDDRDAADALKGQPISVPRGAVQLEPGEFLLADLPGCTVTDPGGRALGTIVEVIHGAQDLLVIHDHAASVERLLPLVPAFLVSVDIATKTVVVDPPEGLPEEPLQKRR